MASRYRVGVVVAAVVMLAAACADTATDPLETSTTPLVGDPTGTDGPGVVTTAAAPTTTVAPTTTAPPQPIVYNGSGTDVVEIDHPFSEGAIMHVTHSGSSNFALWELDENLEQTTLLVNVIGNFEGIVPLDFDLLGVSALEVEADGAWAIEIRSLNTVRRFESGSISGTGPDVITYLGETTVSDISHTGDSNFAIWHYTSTRDLLVNEIGSWSGSVPLRAGVLVIEANGAWTIETS